MKKAIGFICLVTCIGFMLSACSLTYSQNETSGEQNDESQISTVAADESEKERQEETEIETQGNTKSTAVVYFTGTGNTKEVAEKLSDLVDGDLYQIIPENAYTQEDLDYNNDECRANQEMNDDSARPAIQNNLSVTEDYQTVYVGYPIWWGTMPRIIQTFFDTYDLSDAKIYTFCTSGSSGIETSISDLKKDYPQLNIVSGKRFQAGVSEEELQDWISETN